MHFNKPQNELILPDDKNIINCTNTAAKTTATATKIATSPTSLTIEASAKKIRSTPTLGASDKIGTFTVGTATSCTSSTDSGVNISDNETTLTPSPSPSPLSQTVNPFNREYYKNNNNKKTSTADKNNINNFNDDDDDVKILNNTTNFDNKLKITQSEEAQNRQPHHQPQLTQQFIKVENSSNENNFNNTPPPSLRNQFNQQNAIKSENVINISHSPATKAATTTNNDISSQAQRRQQYNEYVDPLQQRSSSQSSLSMSSTTSSHQHHPPSNMHRNGSPAVSIRSIDSSVIDSDSDSDLSDDIEGVHENYVIKKLGTQVSYPPRHPDIPGINKGLTVLNQQITPNGGGLDPPSPLAALSAIGDNLGAAQALGPVPSVSGVAQRPQIGSIALSNSSDVTFGDKHFYEGPVTIQQFLIDGRDKWKEKTGNENPSFENDNTDTHNYAKDINPSSKQSSKLYGYISKRKKFVIPGVLVVMTLLIVATILGSEALNDSKSKLVLGNSEESRKNIPINSTIAQDNVGGGNVLRIVYRDGWLAQPPVNPRVPLDLPVDRVIILSTRTNDCETQAACTYIVRFTQTFNIESQQQDDIIYNFLIGGDGNVYEGRGWDNRGAALKGFNDDSISLAFIGSFKQKSPSDKQLNVTRLLLEEGVRLNKLSSDYKIIAANKLDPSSTETAADALYESFKSWPNWSDN